VSAQVRRLVSAAGARELDREASASWGLDPFALVEAAGRNAARVFAGAWPFTGGLRAGGFHAGGFHAGGVHAGGNLRIAAAAGSGNNGADALVMLRALIVSGWIPAENAAALVNKLPAPGERNPRSEAVRSLEAMGVSVSAWKAGGPPEGVDIIIDGIAGTGLEGPLRGTALEMVEALNALGRSASPFIVSIDIPSGNFDSWTRDMPILKADAVLAVEPLKEALYKPAARPFAGIILPVGEIFPPRLLDSRRGPELIEWEHIRRTLPQIRGDAYKHQRGLVEIRAGSAGSAGAARIAARGAQAAGAGLVRLVADDSIYPILAAGAGGIMVVPAGTAQPGAPEPDPGGSAASAPSFHPDAMLLGPGWGKTPDRPLILRNALIREGQGMPLILDADAIPLAKDLVFHGNAILTPHPGEFAALTGIPKEEALARPGPVLERAAREKQAVILFKGHVTVIAGPEGRLGYLDGMEPVLATGGSGDLLAGLCAALAARAVRAGCFDPYNCAAAAAALLLKAAESADIFLDPLELADRVAAAAASAWLPPRFRPRGFEGNAHGEQGIAET
jgi:NAD(P)H-hydrate epimerase